MATVFTAEDPFHSVRHWKREWTEKGWWHSFELADGTLIEGVCGLAGLKRRIGQFPIPDNLTGKRVLDIGTWDGWFAFEMERRGADVVAIDSWDNPRFREMHARLNSRVDYRQVDMYHLTPDRVGRFDIVLFMGVLYHLKHPLLALERVCALTTGMAAVDSFVLREQHRPGEGVESRPVMEFYETDELGGQTDNWCGPSLPCLIALCRTAGFARVEFMGFMEHSACIACYRRWPAPSTDAAPAPELIEAFHERDFGLNFASHRDDYVSIWFQASAAENLSLDEVRAEVSGYGVRSLHVAALGENLWQANLMLPPGLTPGWHDVSVRIGDGPSSNSKNIAVDLPLLAGAIEIAGVRDAQTWASRQLDSTQGRAVCLWITGLPENADRNNVRVYLAGHRMNVTFVERQSKTGLRQVNIEVPNDVPRGLLELTVAVGDQQSEPADLLIV